MKFFRRKKDEAHKDYVKNDAFEEEIKQMTDKIDRQERIIKYATDKPTFRVCDRWSTLLVPFVKNNDVYFYIGREEFLFCFKELNDKTILDEDCKLKVDDNLAYFDVRIKSENERYYGGQWCHTIYKFIVDFKEGKYVVSSW